MKFGAVDNPSEINFQLPKDRFKTFSGEKNFNVLVGYPKWTKKDLPGLFPKGVKDELNYYATQFNVIELNATFYTDYRSDQVIKWKERTDAGFKFYPKVHRFVSHVKRLKDTRDSVDRFCESVWHFGEKLGTCFLQMHDNFGPENMERLSQFLDYWPVDLPLAIELRHAGWYANQNTYQMLIQLLEKHQITNILTDTAGRRDLLHMNPITSTPFIRFVATGHKSDFSRLDDWTERLGQWEQKGISTVAFFVHQNAEQESPLLSQYLIDQLNNKLSLKIKKPKIITNTQTSLF